MGFLSGLTKIISGGSDSSSQSQSTSGFSLLPKQIQNTYTTYADKLGRQINNIGQTYTPLQQTADETAGINQLRQGYTPTAESLNSDISMLMNPYNNNVINEINRQAGGDYSILKQSLNEAGQFGSNRQNLGANDIDLSRANQIGSFLDNQYNNAIGQVFNNLIPLRQSDTQNLFGIGNFQRDLTDQTKQAKITGLQQIAQALGVLPTNGGSQSTSSASGSQNNGLFSGGSNSGGSGFLSFLSDARVKENIVPCGKENGHNVYEFSYLGDPSRFIGVMAQEVEKTYPEAVSERDGIKSVDYGKIGVRFRRAG